MRICLSQLLAVFIMAVACSPASVQPTESVPTRAAPTEPPAVEFELLNFPGARSQSLATGPDGSLYLIYGHEQSLFVSRSTDSGLNFGEPVLATGDVPVHVLPIEHPAIAVDSAGQVHIAWLEMPPDFHGANIWYAVSKNAGETFEPGKLVATEPEGEVAMVQVAADSANNPVLMWLNESELHFSRSQDGGSTFSNPISIGQGSCECCQPQALVLDENIHIVYRSLEPGNEKGDIRDIVMIHSANGGQTFEPVTRVSDEHWYLPACPIAGPSFAVHEDIFYVAWMDGRFEPPGTFGRGDIWLASSRDRGKTFSPNIRINPDQEMHHTLPTIAVGPSGRVHVAWEAQAQGSRDTFLYYTISDNGGQTFAPPQVIIDNTDSTRGNPSKPVIVVDHLGRITLAWLDRLGARTASWMDTR